MGSHGPILLSFIFGFYSLWIVEAGKSLPAEWFDRDGYYGQPDYIEGFNNPVGPDFDLQRLLIDAERQRSISTTTYSSLKPYANSDQQLLLPSRIDDKYVIVLDIGPTALSEAENVKHITLLVGNAMQVPSSDVHVINFEDSHTAELVVLVKGTNLSEPLSEDNLQLASILLPLIKTGFAELGLLNEVYTKESRPSVYKRTAAYNAIVEFWHDNTLYIIVALSFFAFISGILVLFYCVWRCRRPKRPDPGDVQHASPQQICVYPSAKTLLATTVQPDLSTPSHTPPPLRGRTKGLLERRGSNASLTIDLTSSMSERVQTFSSPPKESSALEFLLSAGNRMSRKELRKCLKNVRQLHEEFWEIPTNHPDRIAVAGSGTKNRYRTIIPNESTRVILSETDSDPLTGYINANFIKGYGGEESTYIATQGPMAHTIDDFWRMVWDQQALAIVMITKLKEKSKIKCESYLPEVNSIYGAIEVQVTNMEQKDGFQVRWITLKSGGEVLRLRHYWYTAWPDHKAPDTARQLLELVKDVEAARLELSLDRKAPIVVHCSAGIGRTGCFIATSVGVRQLQSEQMVDVLGTVCAMRLDRGGMVQTSEQYEFIHQALGLYERELSQTPD